MHDKISDVVLSIIQESAEPLETKEIEEKANEKLKNVTRTKIFYRLNFMRGDGKIKGKFIGPGKGVWIWWNPAAFEIQKKKGKKK